jgi:hypothetical protein
MSFDGTPGHFQLPCDFVIIATLQKKLDDLPLSGSEPDRIFLLGCH